MRSRIFLVLMSITAFSFAETIELFEFGPSNNYSSISLNDYDLDNDTNTVILTARHIGGDSLTSSASTGYDALASNGSAIPGAAAGTTRFAATANMNGYYGPTSFKGVPWVGPTDTPPEGYLDANGGYYVASAADQDVVTIAVKSTELDWTADSGRNTSFNYRLWDKATGIVGGVANTYYIGISIMDTPTQSGSNNNRLQFGVTSSNGTLLSGGDGLTGNQNRTRIAWLGSAGDLSADNDWTFELVVDLSAGTWVAKLDGVETKNGTFNQAHLKGFDRYQTTFQNFSNGDYIDIDEISVSVESNAGQTLLEPVGGYYSTIQDGSGILHTTLTDIYHTNGNVLAKFANVAGQTEWNWTNNVQFIGAEAPFVQSTETLVGTNAAPVTSPWLANEAASVTLGDGSRGYENRFGILRNNDSLFVAPDDNAVVAMNNTTTELILDSEVTLASISGNGATSANSAGSVLNVNTGGVLNVTGQSVHAGQNYRDGYIDLGGWGNGAGSHHMTLIANGGTVNADRIRVAQAKAGGTLNVVNGGAVNTTDLQIGFDAHNWGVGTVNISSGDVTAKTVYVGQASEGILNIVGGNLKVTSDGRVRIGDARGNATTTNPTLWDGGSNLVAKGTINLQAGEIAAADGATNTMLWVGYQNNDTEPKIMANFNVSGGVVNGGENLQMQVGRVSPGTMTLSGDGVVNASSTFTVGHQAQGILNVNGGTFNLSDHSSTNITTRLDVGGHGGGGVVGGNGEVNMTAGTMNLASLYMGNSQTDGEQTSSFTQSGGTVNILGGACRFGVRGEATYTIGGGESLASLIVNPMATISNVSGTASSIINMSYGASSDNVYKDSTFTINSNAFVHVNSITMDSVNGATNDAASATLNLNGGTLLIEGNWNGGINLANDAQLNIGEGELIWAHWMEPLTEYLRQAWTNGNISLTSGITEAPSNSVAILTDGDYVLYGESYNSSNKVYSSEMRVGAPYSRFVSVLANPPSPYDTWAETNGITDPEGDEDSDGIVNLLEFAFGTSPVSSDTGAISSSRSGANISFTHPKREGIDHGLTYVVQTNGNLKFGDWDDYSSADPTEAGSSVTHTISTAAEDELFIRLKVETE
ncbi:MAG: hypothetical protein VXX25_01050 [Verrucomicrobiota bacterium]|nr:hypothetical protein [Verrucomicrobiota bacterium]